MRRISVLNFKGGVGKTSLTTNLAHALALRGARVLIVDCDMQADTSSLLGDAAPPTLTNVLRGQANFKDAIRSGGRDGLDILPADRSLDNAARDIVASGGGAYYRLRNAIKNLAGYDFVLFDHAPSYSAVAETALLATSEMLVPCELAPFSVKAVRDMLEKLAETLTPYDHEIDLIGIVPFKLDERYKMTASYLEVLKKRFGERVLRPVRTDAVISKAQSLGKTVFEYDTSSHATADFQALAEILIPAEVEYAEAH